MKKDNFITFGGVAIASSFYILLFSAVDPYGDWGWSLSFAIGIAIAWSMLKDDGIEHEDNE